MQSLTDLITQHAEYAPWIVFGLLILAGFNVPISEDAMVLGAALLATQRPDMLWPLFIAVYSGAYLSDLICYGLGRRFGPALWRFPGFERVVPRRHIESLGKFYERYGVLTLFVGRFIPFGVRNGLLLTAGLGGMKFSRLALADLGAATVSCSFFFWLYYSHGEQAIEAVRESNYAIIGLLAAALLLLALRKRLMKRLEGGR